MDILPTLCLCRHNNTTTAEVRTTSTDSDGESCTTPCSYTIGTTYATTACPSSSYSTKDSIKRKTRAQFQLSLQVQCFLCSNRHLLALVLLPATAL